MLHSNYYRGKKRILTAAAQSFQLQPLVQRNRLYREKIQ